MNALKCGLGLVLVGGLVLTASCGDSTNDPAVTGGAGAGAMTAGSSSFGGAPSAGAAHILGGASGGGGTGDGGGKNGAGAPGGAGLSGSLNAAGGLSSAGGPAVNPADCPATAPATDETCSSLANPRARCNYGGTSCRCATSEFPGAQSPAGAAGAAGAAAGGPVWQCFEVLVCPAALPVVGEACASAPGMCVYPGEGDCDCGSSGTWTCRLANPCPRLKPMHGSACTGSNFCSYENHSGCVCSANHWVCN